MKIPSSFRPGVGYYFQLGIPDKGGPKELGPDIIGGLSEAEFKLVDHRGVRTRPFTITSQQPTVCSLFYLLIDSAFCIGFCMKKMIDRILVL